MCRVLLRDDGTATFEFPHLLRLLDGLQYDTIYHEHFSYFSLGTTAEIFRAHGLEVYDVEELWTHGGSLRVYAQRTGGPQKTTGAVAELLAREEEEGLFSPERYARFAEDVKESKRALLDLLIRLRREGKQVVGYGAPGKGNTLLNYCGIRTDLLDYTVDRNPYKHGLLHTRHAHPDLLPGEDRGDEARLRPRPAMEPDRRDRSTARLRRGLGRPADRPRAVRNRPQRFQEGSLMKVVIFCGGFGVRMGEETQRIPKPMIQVGNRPILWHIMKWYASWGYDDFVLCLGYKAECVKEYFLNYNEALSNDFVLSNGGREVQLLNSDISSWRITFVDTGTRSTIAERLLAVAPHLDGDYFLATYGDGLTDAPLPEMVDALRSSGKTGLFLSVRPISNAHVVEADADGVVRSVADIQEADVRINGGFFVFRRNVLDYINPGEELVDEPFRRLIEREELIAHRYDGFWQPMDTMKDKQQLDSLAESGRAPWRNNGIPAESQAPTQWSTSSSRAHRFSVAS